MGDFFDDLDYLDVLCVVIILMILFYLYINRDKVMSYIYPKSASSLPVSSLPVSSSPASSESPQVIQLDMINRFDGTDKKTINISNVPKSCMNLQGSCESQYVLEPINLPEYDFYINPIGQLKDPFYVVAIGALPYVIVVKSKQIKDYGRVLNDLMEKFINKNPEKGAEIMAADAELRRQPGYRDDTSLKYFVFPPTADPSKILSQFRGEVIMLEH